MFDIDPVAFRRHDLGDLGAVVGQDCRHLIGADVAGLGHVDDEVGHSESDDRQHHHGHDEGGQPTAHPLPVDPVEEVGTVATGSVAAPATAAAGRGQISGWLRRRAIECGLDHLDRVPQTRIEVVTHRRDDRGRPAIGWDGRTRGTRWPGLVGRRREPGWRSGRTRRRRRTQRRIRARCPTSLAIRLRMARWWGALGRRPARGVSG